MAQAEVAGPSPGITEALTEVIPGVEVAVVGGGQPGRLKQG